MRCNLYIHLCFRCCKHKRPAVSKLISSIGWQDDSGYWHCAFDTQKLCKLCTHDPIQHQYSPARLGTYLPCLLHRLDWCGALRQSFGLRCLGECALMQSLIVSNHRHNCAPGFVLRCSTFCVGIAPLCPNS